VTTTGNLAAPPQGRGDRPRDRRPRGHPGRPRRRAGGRDADRDAAPRLPGGVGRGLVLRARRGRRDVQLRSSAGGLDNPRSCGAGPAPPSYWGPVRPAAHSAPLPSKTGKSTLRYRLRPRVAQAATWGQRGALSRRTPTASGGSARRKESDVAAERHSFASPSMFWCERRPVTPEVAGSSPVAPVSRSTCK
jgi:hypothetical protein